MKSKRPDKVMWRPKRRSKQVGSPPASVRLNKQHIKSLKNQHVNDIVNRIIGDEIIQCLAKAIGRNDTSAKPALHDRIIEIVPDISEELIGPVIDKLKILVRNEFRPSL